MTLAFSNREEAADYPAVVVTLNSRWRVIECRDRIQWILQRRSGKRNGQPRFDGKSYCRTRDGLIAAVRDKAGEIDTAASVILDGLPDWFGGRP